VSTDTPPASRDFLSHLIDKAFERNAIAPRLPGLFEPPASILTVEAQHAWPSADMTTEERDSHASKPIAADYDAEWTRPTAPLVNRTGAKSGSAESSAPRDGHPQGISSPTETGTDGDDVVDSDPSSSPPRPRPFPEAPEDDSESPSITVRQASPPSAPPAHESPAMPLASATLVVPKEDYRLPTTPPIGAERPSLLLDQKDKPQTDTPARNLQRVTSPANPRSAVPPRPSLIPRPFGMPLLANADRPSEHPLPEPEPVINVTIGRVEVKASGTSKTTDSLPARRAAHQAKPLGLADYLKRRGEGR
jgi:hypothetical protein